MLEYSTHPKVSFIIPVYGVEKFIKRCLESIINQTYQNYECIIVDDKTPDDSIQVIQDLLETLSETQKKKFIILHHAENMGLSSARETGILSSKGDYIVHVDGDDYIENDLLEKCLFNDGYSNQDIIIFGTFHEYNDSYIEDLSACKYLDKHQYISDVISQRIPTNIWGKMIKRELYVNRHIHCEKNINYAEDYVVLPKLLWCAKSFLVVRYPLYHYVHYNSGSYTNKFNIKHLCDSSYAIRNLQEYFSNINEFKGELEIKRLKDIAWALRKLYANNLGKSVCSEIFGENSYDLSMVSSFNLNHNIILLLDRMGLNYINRAYVKVSNFFATVIQYKKK